MEKLKMKHNHLLTNLLKVCIFSIVMLAPFFAVSLKCAYVSFNKNAKDSYSQQYVEETINITSSNANTIYLQNQTIQTVITDKVYGSRSGKFGFSKINIDLNELLNTQDIVYKSFEFYTSSSDFMLFYDANETEYRLSNYKNKINGFTYTADLTTYNRTTIYNYVNAYTFTYKTATIDNAFYYAIDQLHEEKVFNWAEHTGIYTAINGMTEGLEMGENNTLALLLSYWAICTAVYIVFDIVIVMFTKITHFIGER